MIKINLKKAQRRVAPAGEYLCNCAVAEIRPTKDKKSTNLHLEWTIDEEAHPEFGGIRLYDERSMKEQSWFRIVELLEAMSPEGEVKADNEAGDLEFDEEALVGEQVGCVVEVDEEYDPDNPRNRVNAYFPASEVGGEAAPEVAPEPVKPVKAAPAKAKR